jgi:hypothetical protein
MNTDPIHTFQYRLNGVGAGENDPIEFIEMCNDAVQSIEVGSGFYLDERYGQALGPHVFELTDKLPGLVGRPRDDDSFSLYHT